MAVSTTQVQEHLALTHHINNYGWFADMYAWDDIANCLTEDCTFDFKIPTDLEGQGWYQLLQHESPLYGHRMANRLFSMTAPMYLNSGTIKGRSNTAKALAAITERFQRTQHNILNMDFDIETSNATAIGRANIFWAAVTEQNGRYVTVQTGCRYTWKFKKSVDKGRWETDYTQVELVWVSSAPVEGFKLVNML
ncbi:uncharacterized protein Z519_00916 [Cladophialophora bantiana CBS 173.52]|uniref:SnoaL-like domain-containing protein n=1 Tax=Cladophialophora bantiana (strain ATCC 10958 / CBS 173.52 / CDC B-1940 / NIH 8579) TaxID=1442370 RepID=A0A0D2I0K3_CLAB1|nr:uncharacterized protein Z519_00916 [Cladophialophora bantiana CBS 173.52]KIW99253.1 hypothetical protein Z519_00916 [Cladophialophora bantiana CBS 173.52]